MAPSRYLGHYVAGHLASRLGIVVELQDSPAGGITARVDVPMGLLADEELDRTLAKAPTPGAGRPSPSWPGPTAAAVSTGTTDQRPARAAVASWSRVDEPELEPTTAAASAPTAEPDERGHDLGAGARRRRGPVPVARRAGRRRSRCRSAASAASPYPAQRAPRCIRWQRTQGRTAVNGEATDERPAANDVATPSGLARRVPGAQRPDAGLAAAHRPSRRSPSRPAPVPRTCTRSSPTSSPAWPEVGPTPPPTPPRDQEDGR